MFQSDLLKNQTIIITGGGTGLGKSMALRFAELGANLVITSRKLDVLEKAAGEIQGKGAKVLVKACDVRKPDEVEAVVEETLKTFGGVDGLVNNAAGNFLCPAENLSVNGWSTVVDIVLNGTFYCSREFGRRHIAARTPGNIVNIGASYAWTGGPGFSHSAAAKAGVKNMTETPRRRVGALRRARERARARAVSASG